MRGLDLDGCHGTGHSPSNVVSSLQLVRSWIHIHLLTWSTEAGSFSVQDDSVGRNTVHFDNQWSLQKKVKNPVTHRCV